MDRIKLTCEGCSKEYDLSKTPELPSHVFFMKCNWCPECEDSATDYYQEWWDEGDNDPNNPAPTPIGDNQLCMPFIMDEIGIKKTEEIVGNIELR